MRTRLLCASFLLAAASGCGGANPTGPNEPCWIYCDGDIVDVNGTLLTPDGTAVPGIEITAQFREGPPRAAATTDAGGDFWFTTYTPNCFPANTHPRGERVPWIWLSCQGCDQAVGSCSGTTTRTVVRYTG
jgi:hypothetical protein